MAAQKGNTELAKDAYGSATFLCQFEPMSFTKIDGVSVKKRAISADPSVTIPTRQVITIGGNTYLVGYGAPDYFKGSAIRTTYVIQGVDGLANLNTIAAELAGTAPTQAYAALVFSRYLPEGGDTSKYPPQYQVFLSGYESAPADSLIYLASKWYLIKDSYISTSGLRIALANEIRGSIFETVTVNSQAYNPVTDTYTSSPVITKIMRIKWTEHFTYLSMAQETYVRGDQQIFILKSAMTPKPSDTLALSDGAWRILDVQDEGLTWSCHARR